MLLRGARCRRCVTCDAEYMEPCLGGDNPAMQKEGYFITVDGADIYRCASKESSTPSLDGLVSLCSAQFHNCKCLEASVGLLVLLRRSSRMLVQ
eukprot:197990-Amphidinium_carterae.1